MAGGSAESIKGYCDELLDASFSQAVIPAALTSSDAAADNALSTLVGTLSSLSKQGKALGTLLLMGHSHLRLWQDSRLGAQLREQTVASTATRSLA